MSASKLDFDSWKTPLYYVAMTASFCFKPILQQSDLLNACYACPAT